MVWDESLWHLAGRNRMLQPSSDRGGCPVLRSNELAETSGSSIKAVFHPKAHALHHAPASLRNIPTSWDPIFSVHVLQLPSVGAFQKLSPSTSLRHPGHPGVDGFGPKALGVLKGDIRPSTGRSKGMDTSDRPRARHHRSGPSRGSGLRTRFPRFLTVPTVQSLRQVQRAINQTPCGNGSITPP